jgi:hypothetical protein
MCDMVRSREQVARGPLGRDRRFGDGAWLSRMENQRLSPDATDPIRVEGGIAADQRKVVAQTLRGAPSVEGIAMMERKDSHTAGVGGLNMQELESIDLQLPEDERLQWLADGKTPQTDQYGRLPQGDDADQFEVAIVADRLAGNGCYAILTADKSQQGMSVQQQFHRTYASKSGNGASKSAPNAIAPLALPKRGWPLACAAGTSSATGWSPSMITTWPPKRASCIQSANSFGANSNATEVIFHLGLGTGHRVETFCQASRKKTRSTDTHPLCLASVTFCSGATRGLIRGSWIESTHDGRLRANLRCGQAALGGVGVRRIQTVGVGKNGSAGMLRPTAGRVRFAPQAGAVDRSDRRGAS